MKILKTLSLALVTSTLLACSLQTTFAQNEVITPKRPDKNLLIGKWDYDHDTSFVYIDRKYTILRPQYGRTQKTTYNAFLLLFEAAEKEGIFLKITSSLRSYSDQKVIWDDKMNRNSEELSADKVRKTLRYLSMPGTSRHHWGTEFDFISTNLDYWRSPNGKKIYEWLKNNAPKYHFFQPYTADAGRTGYCEEPWHWSYAPLSQPYLEEYQNMVKSGDIKGFTGDIYIDTLNIFRDYVGGITQPLPPEYHPNR